MDSQAVDQGYDPVAHDNNGSSVETAPKVKRSRAHDDSVSVFREKVENDPYDISSWQSIVDELKNKDDVESLRTAFEEILKHYPTSAEIWSDYIGVELEHANYEQAEQLFARCLPNVYKVSLWNLYLSYIKTVNDSKEDANKIITEAYEYALDRVGCDRSSGQIWMDYIQFVRSIPTSGTLEHQQQMDLLRNTFTKALCIPLNNIENIWQGYNSFETMLSKRNARKFIDDKSATYMHARSCNKEIRNIIAGLNTSSLPTKRKWTSKEKAQFDIWQNWVAWESKNPLNTTPEIVQRRIIYIYRQACMSLRFFPDCWFTAAQYFLDIGGESSTDEAINVLKDGITANPDSFLLPLKLAEIYEQQKNIEELHNTYRAFIDRLKSGRAKLLAKLGIKPDDADETTDSPAPVSVDEVPRTRDEKLLAFNCEDISFAYSEYLKNVKRVAGLKEARRIFSEARKLPYVNYKVFEASAMMEYYSNKESEISGKIFEIGLKRFGGDASYVKRYFDFLVLIDEEPNARALFEKSVVKMTTSQQKILFLHYIKFESDFGDMFGLTKLMDRFKLLFPEDQPVLTAFRARFQESIREPEYDAIEEVDFGRRYESLPKDLRVRFAEPVEESYEFDDHSDERAQDAPPSKRRKESRELKAPVVRKDVIPAAVVSLLADLPPADSYDTARFDTSKLITMLQVVEPEGPPV